MYEYEYPANPLQVNVPDNISIYLDDIPVEHPCVPRICAEQGYFLVWSTTDKYNDVLDDSLESKKDQQLKCSPDKLDYGQALIYPYESEVIVGVVKYYGYMNKYGEQETNKIIAEVWDDIIKLFGHKTIICPSGSFLEWCHLSMNQKKIPHSPYRRKVMMSRGFTRIDNYWIRNANLLA